jgi:hypothetical protein
MTAHGNRSRLRLISNDHASASTTSIPRLTGSSRTETEALARFAAEFLYRTSWNQATLREWRRPMWRRFLSNAEMRTCTSICKNWGSVYMAIRARISESGRIVPLASTEISAPVSW